MNQEGEKRMEMQKMTFWIWAVVKRLLPSPGAIWRLSVQDNRDTKQLRVHQINILELWRVKSSDHNTIQDLDPGSTTTLISSVSVFLQFFQIKQTQEIEEKDSKMEG